MITSTRSSEVIVIRLDDPSPDVNAHRLRTWLPAHRTGTGDIYAVVVIRADRLLDHHTVLVDVMASRRVDGMVCVVVGRPDTAPSGIVLRGTGVLVQDDVATVWVADPVGVAAELDTVSAVRPAADLLGSDRGGLETLIDCLCVVDVFRKVLAAAGRRVVSPGLRVMLGHTPETALLSALTLGTHDVAGESDDDDAADPAGPLLDDLAVLLGDTSTATDRPHPVLPGSPLDLLRRRAVAAADTVDARLHAVRGASGLWPPTRPGRRIWAELADSDDHVDAYVTEVATILEDFDGPAATSAAGRGELTRRGVRVDDEESLTVTAIAERLREAVVDGLGRFPARVLARQLRDASERAVPLGSAGYLERLDRVVREGRAVVPPFRLPVTPPAILAWAAICCLVAAAGPVPVVSGPLAVLGWLVFACLTLSRVPGPDGEAGWRRMPHLALAAHAVAAGAGAAVGGVFFVREPVAAEVGIVTAAASLAAMAAAATHWWNTAATRWIAAVRPSRTLDLVDELLSEVAALEWSYASGRIFLADRAQAMSAGLAGAGDVLDRFAHDEVGTVPLMSGPCDGALREMVRRDIVDALRVALEPMWDDLIGGSVDHVQAHLDDRLLTLMRDYLRHLLDDGPHEPPPFPTSVPRHARAVGVDGRWGRRGELSALLATPALGWLVQLCSRPDLRLLDSNRRSVSVIRFAPESAVRSADTDGGSPSYPAQRNGSARLYPAPAGNVVPTEIGNLAGVLRLVPVRPGTVELSWPEDGEEGGEP